MLDEALAIEGTEVSLGVADVDREEHGAIIHAHAGRAMRTMPSWRRSFTRSGLAPRYGGAAMLEHKGIAYKRTDLFPVMSQGDPARPRLSGQNGAGAED